MPFYMFIGKPKGKNKKQGRTAMWTTEFTPHKNTIPQPCYPVDPPQEYDDPGKELSPDAQVWKTYVKEADQVDEERVDAWNKSMDVILIFAALFSAISTAFVIESYKNLKPDPADLSAQTLLAISHTLAAIANGSQTPATQPATEAQAEAQEFSASWSAICVNVLWFLSLSLSVAVSLVSMLAKEWCIKFMSGRTGPPGAQTRRRQQRWDRLVSWRMEEVLMILPSLIHLSLLLFAIGLSVFLWDVHFGVAIPVVFITFIAASAYVICTILPFIDDYCPYGTVISILYNRFTASRKQVSDSPADWTQDSITAKALHWIVENCETPRSVDIALQALAGATKSMPYEVLVKWDPWTMIKRRLGDNDPFRWGTNDDPGNTVQARALRSIVSFRDKNDGLEYGSKPESQKLEVLALGLQSCIDSHCDRIHELVSSFDPETKSLLDKCSTIGIQFLKLNNVTRMQGSNESTQAYWKNSVNPENLLDEATTCLVRYLNGTIEPGRTTSLLYAITAFLLCCCPLKLRRQPIMKLLRVYVSQMTNLSNVYYRTPADTGAKKQSLHLWKEYASHRKELYFLMGLHCISSSSSYLCSPCPTEVSQEDYHLLEQSIESIWHFLISAGYPDQDAVNSTTHTSIVLSFMRQHLLYNLSPEDLCTILAFGNDENLPLDCEKWGFDSSFNTELLDLFNCFMARRTDFDGDYTQFLEDFLGLLPVKAYTRVTPTPEIYLLTVKCLCHAETDKQKRTTYELMSRFPFPRMSQRFIESLSNAHIIADLVHALINNDPAIRAFATAQLWLFFSMSIDFPDRTSQTLTVLEQALLKYPVPDKAVDNQGVVADQLGTQLSMLLEENYSLFERDLGFIWQCFTNYGSILTRVAYLLRVLELVIQRRGERLPQRFENVLYRVPDFLRGLGSSMYLEGEGPIDGPALPDPGNLDL